MNASLPEFSSNSKIEVVEKRTVERITLRFYVKNIFDAFNVDRGGIFTIKRLFINPGAMVKDYLSKGRYRYTPPFRLLIITTTIALLLIGYSKTGADFSQGFYRGVQSDDSKDLLNSLRQFQNVFLWLSIPFYTLLQYWLNRKSGFNYTENLVEQTYLFTLANLASLIIALDTFISVALAGTISIGLYFFYYVYAYKVFFKKSWGRSVLENLVIMIGGAIFYALVIASCLLLLGLMLKLA